MSITFYLGMLVCSLIVFGPFVRDRIKFGRWV